MSARFVERALLAVTSVAAGVATFVALYFFETTFAPVVTGWSVTSIEYRDGKVLVSGELTKQRPCRLIQTDVKLTHLDGTSVLVHQVRPTHDVLGVDVTLGHSTWGPIAIPASQHVLKEVRAGDKFVVSALHQCHALWTQHTEYGSVDAERVTRAIGARE